MSRDTNVTLATENEKEAMQVIGLMHEMSPSVQKDFLVFMQGVHFSEALKKYECQKEGE